MSKKYKNHLPDTQPLPDTQEVLMTDDDESLYSEPINNAPVWAMLTYLANPSGRTKPFELRYNKAAFGRDPPEAYDETNVEVFMFTVKNCPPKFVDRISKCHFTIEREIISTKGSDINFSPAVLKCKGRNGLFLNNEKLTINESRILAQNDIVKLTTRFELFQFKYLHTPPDFDILHEDLLKKYHVAHEIGAGGCGYVRLIHHLQTRQKYALKVIKKPTILQVDRLKENAKIANEVNIMKKLSHLHVLNLVDFYDGEEHVFLVMEFMEGGDMLHRIVQPRHDKGPKCLKEMDAKFFFLQACRGLKYLHDSFVTHRDIKPDNILLASDSTDALLKISDFGLSKHFQFNAMKTVCGTQLYLAPEVLFGGVYTNKVDIWSMGCLLFAMLSGSLPFSGSDVQSQIKEGKFEFRSKVWEIISREAKNLIKRMLQKDPSMRPSINKILEHPWLQCQQTTNRVNKLYKQFGLDETLLNETDETELELTLVNVSLNDTPLPPPSKRRRLD